LWLLYVRTCWCGLKHRRVMRCITCGQCGSSWSLIDVWTFEWLSSGAAFYVLTRLLSGHQVLLHAWSCVDRWLEASVLFHRKPISELQSITCHMELHRVTCHHPSQTGWYLIYLPQRDRRLSVPGWLVKYTEIFYLFADSHLPRYYLGWHRATMLIGHSMLS